MVKPSLKFLNMLNSVIITMKSNDYKIPSVPGSPALITSRKNESIEKVNLVRPYKNL